MAEAGVWKGVMIYARDRNVMLPLKSVIIEFVVQGSDKPT
jgi:hypothetical protein